MFCSRLPSLLVFGELASPKIHCFNNNKPKWEASSSIEQKKLAVTESGWKLAGSTETVTSRTRGKKNKDESTTQQCVLLPPVASVASLPQQQADDSTTILALTMSHLIIPGKSYQVLK